MAAYQLPQGGGIIRQAKLCFHVCNQPVHDLVLREIAVQVAVRLIAAAVVQAEPLDLFGVVDGAVFSDAADDFPHLLAVLVHSGAHIVDENRFGHADASFLKWIAMSHWQFLLFPV